MAVPFFFNEFKNNIKFKNDIIKIVTNYIKREKKEFTKNEIGKLCEYVLMELPSCLYGFTYNKTHYNCYTYPYDTLLARFVEKIQNKKLFSEFYKKIGVQTNVFVELKVI